ncbi:class I SAM-dependent methyltransferase [bacterium]|nr:class I SAM-dependent methyltransferase [bacterium]
MKFPEIEIKTSVQGQEGRFFVRASEWAADSINFEFKETLFSTSGLIEFNAQTGTLNIKLSSPIQTHQDKQQEVNAYFKAVIKLFINNFRYGWMPQAHEKTDYTIDYHRGKNYLEASDNEKNIKKMQANIIKLIASPHKALVAGCSDGALVEALQEKEIKTFGFDIVPNLHQMVRPHLKNFIREGSASQIPYNEADSFDTFVAIDVLEHIPENEIALMVEEWLRLDIKKLVLLINLNDWFYEGHITMRPLPWWLSQWSAHFKHVQTFKNFPQFEPLYSNKRTYNQQWVYCEKSFS